MDTPKLDTLRNTAPLMLSTLYAVLELLEDPDASEFDANRVEARIRCTIAQATGGRPHPDLLAAAEAA